MSSSVLFQPVTTAESFITKFTIVRLFFNVGFFIAGEFTEVLEHFEADLSWKENSRNISNILQNILIFKKDSHMSMVFFLMIID